MVFDYALVSIAAVMELTERYELLLADLEQTMHGHQALASRQQLLAADLRVSGDHGATGACHNATLTAREA